MGGCMDGCSVAMDVLLLLPSRKIYRANLDEIWNTNCLCIFCRISRAQGLRGRVDGVTEPHVVAKLFLEYCMIQSLLGPDAVIDTKAQI